MTIYFIITKHSQDKYALVTVHGSTLYEPCYENGFYEAPTRSKAKAMFFKEYDLEFTTQVETRKVVDCTACDNEGYSYVGECPECKGKSYRPDDARVYKEKA